MVIPEGKAGAGMFGIGLVLQDLGRLILTR